MTPIYSAKIYALPAVVMPEVRLRSAYLAERLAAALIVAALAPALLLLAIAISALSRRGPFVRHWRVGWQGRPLGMLKFRTMWDRRVAQPSFRLVEDVAGPPPAPKRGHDSRINSRFAVLCRRYSLDELPQLIHVMRGEMSLVGPRPITRTELDEHYGECADEVLSLRPGLTGLWQVMGRSNLSYATRRRLDLILVRKASTGLYLRVLLRSIPCVVNGRGAY